MFQVHWRAEPRRGSGKRSLIATPSTVPEPVGQLALGNGRGGAGEGSGAASEPGDGGGLRHAQDGVTGKAGQGWPPWRWKWREEGQIHAQRGAGGRLPCSPTPPSAQTRELAAFRAPTLRSPGLPSPLPWERTRGAPLPVAATSVPPPGDPMRGRSKPGMGAPARRPLASAGSCGCGALGAHGAGRGPGVSFRDPGARASGTQPAPPPQLF